ncbi:hypothetical protein LTR49_025835 [Elasticomyces elasticus]|nr:hypothetical protein LTR49_025835 [Elasticomyces elasticus]
MILKRSNVKPDYDTLAKAMSTLECNPSAKGVAACLGNLKATAKYVTHPSLEDYGAMCSHGSNPAGESPVTEKNKKPKTSRKAEEAVKKEEEGGDYGFN